jgi:hypothetical protein
MGVCELFFTGRAKLKFSRMRGKKIFLPKKITKNILLPPPLKNKIKKHPIFGGGGGQEPPCPPPPYAHVFNVFTCHLF